MPSSSQQQPRPRRQQGFGIIEVLVATALLGVAVVVLLGSLASLVLGARVAERRTVEERIARNQIEVIVAQRPRACPSPSTAWVPVDAVNYSVNISCTEIVVSPSLMEIAVTVSDPSGASTTLYDDLVSP